MEIKRLFLIRISNNFSGFFIFFIYFSLIHSFLFFSRNSNKEYFLYFIYCWFDSHMNRLQVASSHSMGSVCVLAYGFFFSIPTVIGCLLKTTFAVVVYNYNYINIIFACKTIVLLYFFFCFLVHMALCCMNSWMGMCFYRNFNRILLNYSHSQLIQNTAKSFCEYRRALCVPPFRDLERARIHICISCNFKNNTNYYWFGKWVLKTIHFHLVSRSFMNDEYDTIRYQQSVVQHLNTSINLNISLLSQSFCFWMAFYEE